MLKKCYCMFMDIPSEQQNHLPVNPNELIKIDDKDTLFGHVSVPAVVRYESDFGMHLTPSEKLDSTVNDLKQARELFKELEEFYDIETAGFNPVVASYTGKDIGGMVVSPLVEGWNRKDAADLTDTEIPAAKRLLLKLSKYVADKQYSGDDLLTDIGTIKQYLYVPEKDEFVLVDTDPYFDGDIEYRQLFFADLKEWGSKVLNPDEFKTWYDSMPVKLDADRKAA